MSLFDRVKGQIQAAGKGAQKLSRIGQLKLDFMQAETKLKDAYRYLGMALAEKLIDEDMPQIDAGAPVIAERLESVRRARIALAEVTAEMEAAKEL